VSARLRHRGEEEQLDPTQIRVRAALVEARTSREGRVVPPKQ